MVFTRPVRRFEYLIGKYFGVALAIGLAIVIMTAAMVLMLFVSRIELRPAVFAAVYLSILEMAVMCSVVLFFSTFTTPILTSLFSLCFFVAGSLSNDLRAFAQKFGGAFMKYIADGLYFLLPNLKVFNLRHEAVHDLYITGSEIALPTLYAAVYCAVILFFAHLIFRRREFV
jgi:ABC-type transport system involved in multi-copper enzyme maturation permease subunit